MSDFNSSLPVRTENPGDVIAKIADATTPSQQLAVDSSGRIDVKLHDGTGNSITSQVNGAQQALDVGINVAGVQIDPRQIRALTAADVVTVQQGTSPWITKDQSDGPVTPGTVATFSGLIGGQYNTVLPTLTNGQQAAIQVDSSGRLLVTTTSTDDHNYGTVGANTLRTAAQIGNATGAADFNFGTVGAQTLRVAGQIGNATGAADFGAGATTAQTLRVTANQGTTPWVTSVNNLPATVDTNYGTVGASTIRTAAQIGNATGAADFGAGATTAQTLRVASNLFVGGASVSTANPVPVTVETAPGTHINDYKRAVAIAAGASDNHDYTVTAGKTLYLNQLESSGSGKVKMQVDVETGVATNVFTTYWSQFNSTATPNMHISVQNPILVAAGVRVRLVMTNKDTAAEDIYSTISGYEL